MQRNTTWNKFLYETLINALFSAVECICSCLPLNMLIHSGEIKRNDTEREVLHMLSNDVRNIWNKIVYFIQICLPLSRTLWGLTDLEDRNSSWWTSNPTLHVQRSTRHEECISTHCVTSFTQGLKIPHLADWCTF